jgi:hypothetical protein
MRTAWGYDPGCEAREPQRPSWLAAAAFLAGAIAGIAVWRWRHR